MLSIQTTKMLTQTTNTKENSVFFTFLYFINEYFTFMSIFYFLKYFYTFLCIFLFYERIFRQSSKI